MVIKKDYSIGYPPRYILNRKITWGISSISLEENNCRGDCPLIRKEETKNIGNYTVKKYSVEVGAIGGNIPSKNITYEIKIPNKSDYFFIGISNIEKDISYEESITYYPIEEPMPEIPLEQEKILEDIILTLKFLYN